MYLRVVTVQGLDLLDQQCRGVCHLLGRLHEVPLGDGVGRLGGGYTAGVAQGGRVLGDESGG